MAAIFDNEWFVDMGRFYNTFDHWNIPDIIVPYYGSAEGPCEVFKKVFVSPN